MSFESTLLLGFVAGVTILLGMPVGRLQRPAASLRVLLNATAVGVLLFLVWDVLTHAWEPVEGSLADLHEHGGGAGPVVGYSALFVVGLSVGLLSLVAYERWMATVASTRGPARPEPRFGPGAMSSDQLTARPGIGSWSPARRLSLLIAVGIGLHNFAEGLAIGQSSAEGEVALATVLVIGFALHNATEGFGIVAPLAGDVDEDGLQRRPTWRFLLVLGAIGGGPTFVGTATGFGFTSEPVSVLFLTLAAGSMLYVVAQLLGIAARSGRRDLLAYGMLLGLVAGFATDGILIAAGA